MHWEHQPLWPTFVFSLTCQTPGCGDHRAHFSQGAGDGLLFRVSCRTPGSSPHVAEGPWQYLFHGCDREHAWWLTLCGLCQRQVRLACYCASGCAGARAAEYPRCPFSHRLKRRHQMATATDRSEGRAAGNRQSRSESIDASFRSSRGVLAVVSAAARGVDVRARNKTLRREILMSVYWG